jgi:hypothetical protein
MHNPPIVSYLRNWETLSQGFVWRILNRKDIVKPMLFTNSKCSLKHSSRSLDEAHEPLKVFMKVISPCREALFLLVIWSQ